ncbi:hypothetical protein J7L81_02380 [Candidatus Aerophobetes bacterium]|nr:hypothetical protein [Candidatus Aerophobetes bacterium]
MGIWKKKSRRGDNWSHESLSSFCQLDSFLLTYLATFFAGVTTQLVFLVISPLSTKRPSSECPSYELEKTVLSHHGGAPSDMSRSASAHIFLPHDIEGLSAERAQDTIPNSDVGQEQVESMGGLDQIDVAPLITLYFVVDGSEQVFQVRSRVDAIHMIEKRIGIKIASNLPVVYEQKKISLQHNTQILTTRRIIPLGAKYVHFAGVEKAVHYSLEITQVIYLLNTRIIMHKEDWEVVQEIVG